MFEIDLDELYILNQILDKRDIFAIPSIRNKKIPSLLAEKIYKSLIKKEILIDKNTFTKKGANLVKIISDYKSASKYVKLGALTIGMYKAGYGIGVIENPFAKTYSFMRMSTEFDEEALKKMYKYYEYDNKSEPICEGNISFEELQSKVGFKPYNSLFISSFDMKKAEKDLQEALSNEVIFYYTGHHYRYDRKKSILYACSKNEVREAIFERLVYV